MSMITILTQALMEVCPRVYPDIGPEGVEKPYITWQQVGGEPINFVGPGTPSKKNARVQVNVWAATRLDADQMAIQVEDTLRAATALQTTVLGSPMADYEPETKLRGSMQDFSLWF